VKALALAAVLGALAAAALERGTATITPRSGAKIVVQVEIADTSAERQKGLMYRRTLPARSGMVFEYAQATRGGFWMKNTLIPLDIAFYDARGRILKTLTMTPCRRDPCRIYDPGVAYRGALEVNGGSFRRWNVRAGDRLVVRAR
jgi:uncharacterized membrane protein (UPF0127 family)